MSKMICSKSKVKKILLELKKIPSIDIQDRHGALDFNKVKKNKDISKIVNKLREIGCTNRYLRENFFYDTIALTGML